MLNEISKAQRRKHHTISPLQNTIPWALHQSAYSLLQETLRLGLLTTNIPSQKEEVRRDSRPSTEIPATPSCSSRLPLRYSVTACGLLVSGIAIIYKRQTVNWSRDFLCTTVGKLSSMLGWDFWWCNCLRVTDTPGSNPSPCSARKPNKVTGPPSWTSVETRFDLTLVPYLGEHACDYIIPEEKVWQHSLLSED